MNKELFVASTPHESRIALSEDGDLTEVYYEREREYSLAGSIYKGRVTRVLPGMQSAFVDIGLERDAFLYVSDFFEDVEEYDRVVTEAEQAAEEVTRGDLPARVALPPEALGEAGVIERAAPQAAEPAPEAQAGAPARERPAAPEREGGRVGRHRGRRRHGRGGRQGFPDSKFARPGADASPAEPPAAAPESQPAAPPTVAAAAPSPEKFEYPFVLPGETLAKYQHSGPSHEVETVVADAAGRAAFEHERMQPDSPVEPEPRLESSDALASPPAPPQHQAEPEEPEELRAPDEPEAAGDEEFAAEALALPAEGESEPEPGASGEQAEEPARAELRERQPQARFEVRAHRRRRRGRGGRGGAAPRGSENGAPAAETEAAPPVEVEEPAARGPRLIGDLLRAGQEILVQIAKEPLGTKGARITSHLALPGRFLVYMPTVHHIGVSRKIGSDEERARLKRIILENSRDLPGGFIVRTAAQGISDDDLKVDIRFLGNLWAEIRREFEQKRAPALLHHDLGLLERTLRDQLSEEFTHVWVDSEEQYQAVVRFVNHFMPRLTGRVRLYTRDEPMFDHFGIQEEINKALKSKVWLKSGGYIVINQTEALVAIDVNTGKYVGKSNRLEDTIVKINVDAIREIVRQIRLRDLGGIIVIDFIDMDERKNRHKVMQALEEAMRADRAPSKVLSFNDFGLVALTRKRVKQSLERTLGTPCPYCSGVGLVKSVTTVCNEIYAEARKMARSIEREDMVLRVNPEVARTLKAKSARLLMEMEELTGKAIAVKSDPLVHQEQFEIF